MKISARFLLILDDAHRAFLFDGEQKLLGEVIEDDGFIVDELLRAARECPPPRERMLSAVVPAPAAHAMVRFYELH
jgi:hypothetical protein